MQILPFFTPPFCSDAQIKVCVEVEQTYKTLFSQQQPFLRSLYLDVKKDVAKAVHLYTQSAEFGFAPAMSDSFQRCRRSGA